MVQATGRAGRNNEPGKKQFISDKKSRVVEQQLSV